MKLHQRSENFSKAKIDLDLILISWMNKYQLTIIEILNILNDLVKNQLVYLLREERHPNEPGKKADEE